MFRVLSYLLIMGSASLSGGVKISDGVMEAGEDSAGLVRQDDRNGSAEAHPAMADEDDDYEDEERVNSEDAHPSKVWAVALSEESLKAGKKFVATQYGACAAHYLNGMRHLGRYWAEVAQGAGHTGTNQSHTFPTFNITHAASLVKDFTTCLRTHMSTHNIPASGCPDDFLSMGKCIHTWHCLIEHEVPTSISPEMYTVMVEVETNIKEYIMADLIVLEIKMEPNHTKPANYLQLCAGEAALVQEGAAILSARAASALAAVDKIHEATVRTEKYLENLDLMQGNISMLESIWSEACQSMKCPYMTWYDIAHSMHDHLAECIESSVPGSGIRKHVLSMRRANYLLARWAPNLMQTGLNHRFFMKIKAHFGTRRYNAHLKRAGHVMDGATSALAGTNKRISTHFWCWKGSVSWNAAHILNIAPTGWGISFQLKTSRSFGINALMDIFAQRSTCPPWGASLDLNTVIGFVGGPEMTSWRAGVSLTIGLSMNGCNLDLSVKAGGGAGMAFSGGVGCALPYTCKNSGTIGFAFWCCSVSLIGGGSSC